ALRHLGHGTHPCSRAPRDRAGFSGSEIVDRMFRCRPATGLGSVGTEKFLWRCTHQSTERAEMLPFPSMRSSILAATAAMALASSGCASVAGVQDIAVDFQVIPQGDGRFFRWNEITTSQDTSSVTRATLLSATLDAQSPPGTPDLSFIK